VFVYPSADRNDATVINVIHYSLRGNAYERPKQYHVYTRGLNDGSWQWLGQRFSDANVWMVGELKHMGGGSYQYREWLYHADPRTFGFDNGQSVTVARCGG
jgi:hypothetical protein